MRSLDNRLQHALAVLVSEKRLQEIVALDRKAALLSGKYARQIRATGEGKTTASTRLSPAELRELASKAGAAEHQLFLALKKERSQYDQALASNGAVSLIPPLNLAGIEVARLVRLRTGGLTTEIPDLGETAVCRGDIVTDRMIYRYTRAVTAEDQLETTRALRDIQIQLACMSTRQIRVFENALVEAIEWTDKVGVPSRNRKRAAAIRNSFRQLFAPVVFATADASRLFPKYERPGIRWLLKHKDMLSKMALRKATIANRVGLLFGNRFSGKLRHIVGECEPGAEKIFADASGRRTCNPLGALFQSVALNCDVTQWVPVNRNGAKSFMCDPSCGNFPGSGTSRKPTVPGILTPCSLSGPHIGGGSAQNGSLNEGGGMPGQGNHGGSQGNCGADPMYGVISAESPSQAYNNAFNACVNALANNRLNRLLGTELTGYAPGGNRRCMIADAAAVPDEAPPANDDKKDAEAKENLDFAKEAVKAVIDGFVQFLNGLAGGEVISQEATEAAKTAVDNAQFGDAGQCEGGPCEGSTSDDGETITINEDYCANSYDCFSVMLHEAMHSAFTGTEFDEDEQHAIFGTRPGETSSFFGGSRGVKLCLQDEPSCTSGCTSREAAMPDCAKAALDAYQQRIRDIRQATKDCATDACWNPSGDDGTRGQECGSPDRCRGQSVALCTEDQPDCMCRDNGQDLNPDLKVALREQMWHDYCERAYDERCSSPTLPDDFGGTSGASPPGARPGPALANSKRGVTFGAGKITILTDGIVMLGTSTTPRSGPDDPDCMSISCRASQRGDW